MNLIIDKSSTDFRWHFYANKKGELQGIALEVKPGNYTPGVVTQIVGAANKSAPEDGTWKVGQVIRNDPKNLMRRFETLHPHWNVGCIIRN